MQFNLVYEGSLTTNGSVSQKHDIRLKLHPQLVELWKHPPLRYYHEEVSNFDLLQVGAPENRSALFDVGGHSFASIVTTRLNLICDLDILFLRRDTPGKFISRGGDIDNRLKTLFDALRLPTEDQIPKRWKPTSDEVPFHCVMEDDSLIAGLSVTTDRLLTRGPDEHVLLIIRVQTRPMLINGVNLEMCF